MIKRKMKNKILTIVVGTTILLASIVLALGIPHAYAQSHYQQQQQQQNSSGSGRVDTPLTNVVAKQTNNIVGLHAYYDISFRVGTAAAIKSIEMQFPADTNVKNPGLLEVEGLGSIAGITSSFVG